MSEVGAEAEPKAICEVRVKRPWGRPVQDGQKGAAEDLRVLRIALERAQRSTTRSNKRQAEIVGWLTEIITLFTEVVPPSPRGAGGRPPAQGPEADTVDLKNFRKAMKRARPRVESSLLESRSWERIVELLRMLQNRYTEEQFQRQGIARRSA